MNRKIRQTVLPLIAAMIWGTAFVFQSMSTEYLGPLTFTALRAAIAAAALIPVMWGAKLIRKKKGLPSAKRNPRRLILGGFCCGAVLSAAAALQQAGLADTSAGKTAFITALYIVIVPVAGLFFGRRVSSSVWAGVLLAVAGLYCLCMKESFSISKSDFIVLLCAFGFAGHILAVDHFVSSCDGIELSFLQFVFEALFCTVAAFLFETPSLSGILMCLGSLLYVGVFSSAVAFTLQIIAQKDANPTVVSILLSLESLFGAISGALILNESMSAKEIIGCVLMLAATILAQLPEKNEIRTAS